MLNASFRGMLNASFKVKGVVRDRLAQRLPFNAFFRMMHKAYNTNPQPLLLNRLAAQGVTSKAWRVIDQTYADASSRERADAAMSESLHVERGVAQGFPVLPFSCTTDVVDSLLELADVRAECRAPGIQMDTRSLVG